MAVFNCKSGGVNAVFKHRNSYLIIENTSNVFDFSCAA